MPPDPLQPARPSPPATIESAFRSGSLTAISVVVGFSLSFLNRWAGLPGPWYATDLVAVGLIVLGTALQILSLASLLSTRSLVMSSYNRALGMFLAGLALVACGVGTAIVGDIAGHGQRVLGG